MKHNNEDALKLSPLEDFCLAQGVLTTSSLKWRKHKFEWRIKSLLFIFPYSYISFVINLDSWEFWMCETGGIHLVKWSDRLGQMRSKCKCFEKITSKYEQILSKCKKKDEQMLCKCQKNKQIMSKYDQMRANSEPKSNDWTKMLTVKCPLV